MTRFEKWLVLGSSLLTVLTGIGYLWVKYLLEPAGPWAVVNHPLQPWLLKAHILVSPLLVFAVGAITLRHVWQHIRRRVRLGRRSGLTTAASLVPMVLTGYLIQAVTAEGWLLAMAYAHIGFGLAYAVGLGLHYGAIRRGGGREAARAGAVPAAGTAATAAQSPLKRTAAGGSRAGSQLPSPVPSPAPRERAGEPERAG